MTNIAAFDAVTHAGTGVELMSGAFLPGAFLSEATAKVVPSARVRRTGYATPILTTKPTHANTKLVDLQGSTPRSCTPV